MWKYFMDIHNLSSQNFCKKMLNLILLKVRYPVASSHTWNFHHVDVFESAEPNNTCTGTVEHRTVLNYLTLHFHTRKCTEGKVEVLWPGNVTNVLELTKNSIYFTYKTKKIIKCSNILKITCTYKHKFYGKSLDTFEIFIFLTLANW